MLAVTLAPTLKGDFAMTHPVRWAILGAAKFAREHMGPAIHLARGADLAAIATRSPEKAIPFQDMHPGIRVIDSYDAVLADPDIDAVYIPLPNTMHVEWSHKALDAGKHVLCEKPMTMQAKEFDALIAKREATGLLAAEAYMIVHHPQWQRVKSLLAEGAIGRLVHVDGAFSFDNRAETDNIRNQAAMGGGGLRDIGVYTMGSVRFATDAEPETVDARIEWQDGYDTFAHVTAQFPGFTYSAFTSIRMHPRQEMTFHGENGVIRLTTPFNAAVFGQAQIEIHRDLTVEVERFPAAKQYVNQVEAFCRSVTTGETYPCPWEFSQGTQAMMDRAFAAGGSGT
jgi:predicted dehydrogenase